MFVSILMETLEATFANVWKGTQVIRTSPQDAKVGIISLKISSHTLISNSHVIEVNIHGCFLLL